METGTVAVEWRGMVVDAADPAEIGGLTPHLSPDTARGTERAAAAVVRTADRTADGPEAAAR
ncbi:MAG: hypothetical protein ACRDUY_01355 [Nitriliruptorales bacterium]